MGSMFGGGGGGSSVGQSFQRLPAPMIPGTRGQGAVNRAQQALGGAPAQGYGGAYQALVDAMLARRAGPMAGGASYAPPGPAPMANPQAQGVWAQRGHPQAWILDRIRGTGDGGGARLTGGTRSVGGIGSDYAASRR